VEDDGEEEEEGGHDKVDDNEEVDDDVGEGDFVMIMMKLIVRNTEIIMTKEDTMISVFYENYDYDEDQGKMIMFDGNGL
jgi:hypothetical protein